MYKLINTACIRTQVKNYIFSHKNHFLRKICEIGDDCVTCDQPVLQRQIPLVFPHMQHLGILEESEHKRRITGNAEEDSGLVTREGPQNAVQGLGFPSHCRQSTVCCTWAWVAQNAEETRVSVVTPNSKVVYTPHKTG